MGEIRLVKKVDQIKAVALLMVSLGTFALAESAHAMFNFNFNFGFGGLPGTSYSPYLFNSFAQYQPRYFVSPMVPQFQYFPFMAQSYMPQNNFYSPYVMGVNRFGSIGAGYGFSTYSSFGSMFNNRRAKKIEYSRPKIKEIPLEEVKRTARHDNDTWNDINLRSALSINNKVHSAGQPIVDSDSCFVQPRRRNAMRGLDTGKNSFPSGTPGFAFDSFTENSRRFAQDVFQKTKNSSASSFTLEDGGVKKIVLAESATDRQTQVKKISQDAYDGVRTQDFVDRMKVISEAASSHLKSLGHSDSEIQKMTASTQVKLENDSKIEWERVRNEMKADRIDHFLDRQKIATQILSQFTTEVSALISKVTNTKFSTSNLARLENEYNMQQGRDNIVHIYEFNKAQTAGLSGALSNSNDITHYLSIHRPMARKGPVQTSAIRDRVGLPNAIETSFHTVDGKGRIETLFAGYRHSSYSPISVLDLLERRRVAMQNFIKMLEHIVGNHVAETKTCPKEVNLSSMMLLTPLKLDKITRGTQSEVMQLEESYQVSRMFEGREVEIKGCTVTPRTTLMNIGANGIDVLSEKLFLKSTIEPGINAKGYYDFEESTRGFLVKNFLSLQKEAKAFSDVPVALEQDLASEWNSLIQLYDRKPQKVIELEAKAKAVKFETISLYSNLHKLQLLESPISAIKNAIRELYKNIEDQEKVLQGYYLEIESLKKKDYSRNRDLIKHSESAVISKMNTLLQTVSAGPNSENRKTWLTAFGKVRDVIRLHGNTKEVYLSNLAHTEELKLDFQRDYVIANYLMGNSVEFFCKSAEDRTGRLNNKIEESLVFRTTFGEYPVFDNSTHQALIKQIATRVYHGGASRDTTGMNNPGARGLQIGSDPHYGKTAQIEKAMGTMAKKIYK